MQRLREIIGNHAGRHPASVAVITLLWPYLNRVAKRFEALVRRVEAGTLEKPRAASLAPRVRLPQFGPPCLRRPGLPTSFAWLIRLVPFEAACVGGQVRYLLVKPEMAALFLAAPQVARIFRPLCRMLGVAPGPDLPPGLFENRVRREKQASALTPTLSPKREREQKASALTPTLSPEREREQKASARTPALSPEREKQASVSETYWPVPNNWSNLRGNRPGRRARPRLPAFRAAPA
jgi:hypothetical protein